MHKEGFENREGSVIASLLSSREQFLRFIRSKVNDADLSEDIFQDSLLKALRAENSIQDATKLTSWFYAILRNSIIDAYRKNDTQARMLEQQKLEVAQDPSPIEERELCNCFKELLPLLKTDYREIIESDLKNESTLDLSTRLGVTANNLKVRRHRARAELKSLLVDTCRTCAKHGCLDCTCASSTA